MIKIRSVYTVAQINAYVKNMFTQDYLLQSVYVKGEVSNCKYHSSGHIYFTLKDPKGTISCVMFAGNQRGLSFRMQDGQQVIVFGSVDVYERDGKYQLYAKQVTLDGIGRLYEEYERLKTELSELGMFAQEYKQPIPKNVKTLGVVTARTGAAVRDIIQISKRRNPFLQIILYPAIVQGEDAAPSIVNGIHAMEKLGVDVIIVGRGGGSIEDLWAFNERIVAEAVFNCSIPIISAVGHETDTTIIDFVADLRAPTPSAAAELAVGNVRETFDRISAYESALSTGMARAIQRKRNEVVNLEKLLQSRRPEARIRRYRLDHARLSDQLNASMLTLLRARRHVLELYIERMKGLSPLEKLSSGYSYVENGCGKNVRSIADVKEGEILKINVRDGQIMTSVLETKGRE